MKKFIINILFLLLSGHQAYSQNNIGFIDYQKVENEIILKHPEFIKKQLETERLRVELINAILILHEKVIDSEERDSLSKKSIMDSTQIFETSMDSLKKQLELFDIEEANQDSIIKTKVRLLLSDICKTEKITCLVDKENAIVYCPDCGDYTEKIIECLRGKR